MTESLFEDYPGDDSPRPEPYEGLGQDARRTARQREQISSGWHPVAKTPVNPNGMTCGDCAHLILKDGPALGIGGGRWWKCTELLRDGRGPDIRKSWPACAGFEAKEET